MNEKDLRKLTREELLKIADLMLRDITEEITSMGAKFVITDAGKEAIVDEGYIYKYGARPMRRTIQNAIENPLAELAIAGDIEAGSTVTVDADETGKIVCKVK